jgi:hypothetical protein
MAKVAVGVSRRTSRHQILKNLTQYGYAGIDERTKVQYLLEGIKTDKLDVPKSTILSKQRFQNNFDACVTFYKSFLKQKSTHKTPTRKIYQISREPNNSVEDLYYSKEEYNKLMAEQKEALCQKHLKRGHKPGAKTSKVLEKDSKKQKTGKYGNKLLHRNISALTKMVSVLAEKMNAKDVPDVILTDGSLNTESTANSNQNNSALTRQCWKGDANL